MNRVVSSPLGNIQLTVSGNKLTELIFTKKKPSKKAKSSVLDKAETALKKYFAGNTDALNNLPLEPEGTDFQKQVWKELLKIKSGKTKTYSEIAAKIKKPKASRAVGNAVGKNPICIAIPCHRVLGKNHLGGFSAGIERKIFLLEHEGR